MKKRSGFTLIELLAVIIILAIIALIATPIITNVVEDTRKEGFKQTALSYYKAAEYVYNEMFLDNKKEDIIFTFEDGNQISSNSNYQLETKGETPKEGVVYLSQDGEIRVSINNKKYCVTVNNNKEVNLIEDIINCESKISDIPERCFTISNEALTDDTGFLGMFDYSEDWMNEEYNMLYYNVGEGCPNDIGILIIPSEINGEKVEGIGNSGFYGTFIKQLIIPSGIKVLNDWAFPEVGLTNIILPDSLIYIGSGAFITNQLTSAIIPNNVKMIGIDAFSTNQLTSIVIPDSVTSIGSAAFYNNQLTSVSIPDSVTLIEEEAFSNNQFADANAIIIEGDAARFDSNWTRIGFPAK